MKLDSIPLFERLAGSKKVLLAGAGGGFDIFSGLPLYFALEARGCEVHLANLSFSRLPIRDPERSFCRVDADTQNGASYFPEGFLSQWFRAQQGREVPIWAFAKTGVQPLRRAYEQVLAETGADTIVLVDGGTDSLMRGDESGLGTPEEDMASIGAVHGLVLPQLHTRLLVSVGFGVDSFHGVAHAEVLEAIAALDKLGAYLGAVSLLRGMPAVELYRQACRFVFAKMPAMPSIVNASILSAIDGEFGDHHETARTRGSRLFINPLMSLMFAFELAPLADRVLYLEMLENTQSMGQIAAMIEAVRKSAGSKSRPQLPM